MAALTALRASRRLLCAQFASRNALLAVRSMAFKRPDTPGPDPELYSKTLPERGHMERGTFPDEHGLERPKGKIYDKKPFKVDLKADKRYSWCSCGHSKNQPFCDGAHKALDGTSFKKRVPKFRPVRFQVEEDGEYWLCNCKQTSTGPYCDLTHRDPDIQAAIRS